MFFKRVAYIFIVILMLVLFLEYPGWLSLFLLIITIALPFVSLLSCLLIKKRIDVSFSFKSFIYPKDREEISILVRSNDELSSLFFATLYVVDMSSGETVEKSIKNGQDSFLYIPKHCGAYGVILSKPGVLDPLSLFRLPVKAPEAEFFFAFPRKKKIEKPMDFSEILNSSYVKKPGGGAASAYEIKNYKPGDPVTDIHWKLSAKSKDGSLLVKEAQERALKEIVITFDIDEDREKRDLMFSHLLWLLADLKEKGLAATCIYYSDNEKNEMHIETDEDIRELFCLILRLPFEENTSSLKNADFSGRGWHYHVS